MMQRTRVTLAMYRPSLMHKPLLDYRHDLEEYAHPRTVTLGVRSVHDCILCILFTMCTVGGCVVQVEAAVYAGSARVQIRNLRHLVCVRLHVDVGSNFYMTMPGANRHASVICCCAGGCVCVFRRCAYFPQDTLSSCG